MEDRRKYILFRADGNPVIGSGHVMRCLSLAAAFHERGYECCFVSADRAMQEMIALAGYQSNCLDSDWRNPEGELPRLLCLIEVIRPHFLVVDSYFVRDAYLKELKKHVYVACFDDLNDFRRPAHAVINYNVSSADMDYGGRYAGTGTLTLCGPSYAPLREEFKGLPARTIREAGHILISAGGADPQHMALFFLELAEEKKEWSDRRFSIVAGPLNPDIEELEKRAAGLVNVRICTGIRSISGLMTECDLAVSAGGSTLYELCACGTPAITYVTADNQIEHVKKFESSGYMPCAGDCRDRAEFRERITAKVNEMICMDAGTLTAISRREQALVDGRGAERIAEAMIERHGR